VGDGNFHVGLYANPNDASEVAQVKAAYDRMVARALAMGGTCTGEHGIGSGKIKYLEMEHGPAIKVMRSIKQALDPDNILNPGKIFRL
jgi:D-lactate dehydrogenase (cytochrome)